MPDADATRAKLILWVSCGVCLAVTILIIVLVSIGTVEPIEYGIVYNALTKKVDPSMVYTGGWYMIGPVNSFVVFPSTLVNMDFTDYPGAISPPLSVKDSAGQNIKLSFSIQYKLIQKDVGLLYSKYLTTYEPRYVSYIDQEARSVVQNFDNNAFWTTRKRAGDDLREKINKRLVDEYAECVNLQLINIQLEQKREDMLILTQTTTQQSKTKKQIQDAEATRKETEKKESSFKKDITAIMGKANADSTDIMAKADREATKTVIDATTSAYKQITTDLSFTPENNLHKFIYYTDLQQTKNVDMYFGINKALISLKS